MCGDFNIDLLKSESCKPTQEFTDMMFAFGFYPLITKPTRISLNSATLIDNIFTNVMYSSTNGVIVTDSIVVYRFCEYGVAPSIRGTSTGQLSRYDAARHGVCLCLCEPYE